MVEAAHKRLREAEYFLRSAREYGIKRFHRSPEEMEYLVNAFLNAARGVQNAARHSEGAAFKHWYSTWESSLSDDERLLLVSMIDKRNEVTHAGESNSAWDMEWVPSSRLPVNRDGGYAIVLALPGIAESAIGIRVTYFEIGATTLEAVECCSQYFDLMVRLLADYELSTQP